MILDSQTFTPVEVTGPCTCCGGEPDDRDGWSKVVGGKRAWWHEVCVSPQMIEHEKQKDRIKNRFKKRYGH